jgi:aspartate/methionine/tyrosine aminotransferase
MFKLAEKVTENHTRFDIGDPDFETPRSVKQTTIDAIKRGYTHYTPSTGISLLKEAICDYTHDTLGYKPSMNQICVSPGCNALIYAIIRCLVKEGEAVAIPDPGFPTYRSVLDLLNIESIPLPLLEENDFNVNPEDVKNLPKHVKLVIVNSPNNPTGSMISSQKEANRISEYCNNKGMYLLSDEIYSLMTYGHTHYSPSDLEKCLKHTIVISGFSKSFAMSGYRLGYCIAPDWLTEKIGLLMQTIVSCTNEFVQYSGIEALQRIPSEISYNLDVLTKRRNHIVEGLNSIQGITCKSTKGAFYVFPNIKGTGMTSREFADKMFKSNVALLPGTDFGKYGDGYVRLAFTQSQIEARIGLSRMERALFGTDKLFVDTKVVYPERT